jgi:hypothetical protein
MEIDFDLSSNKWRANKKYLGKGVFIYKCQHISTTTNNYCKNKIFNNMLCKYHYFQKNKKITNIYKI